MILQENLEINGKSFVRTYSSENRYVVRDGVEYSEAIDPAEFGRTYTEGDKIPADEIEQDAQEILDIILGGEEE